LSPDARQEPGNLDPAVDAEQLAQIPICVECGLVWWPDTEDRFTAWWTDDESPELAFYCSECSERQFGER
jgi:hypothetical protein